MTPEIEKLLGRKLLKPFRAGLVKPDSSLMVEEFLQKGQQLYKLFSDQVALHKPEIHLAGTTNLRTDAFVSNLAGDHAYLVCLSYGLFANLHACFSGLMSHPEIMPHIGNPGNTNCRFTVADYGLLDFTFDNEAVRQNTPFEEGFPLWNYPLDEERILYALLLTDIACEYILYHEWGHILGGHLQYIMQVWGATDIGEVATVEPTAASPIIMGEPIRKILEFEADYIAAKMVAGIPHALQVHKRTFFQAYPASFLEKYDLRDAVVFSLMGLFHLFRELQVKENKTNSANYPAPYFRFCSLLFGIFRGENSEWTDQWDDYDYRGASEFARVSQLLQFDFLFSEEIYNPEATNAEILKLDDILTAVAPLLAPYRLAGLDGIREDLFVNSRKV